MKCCLQDLDGYDLTSRGECTREIPELVAAVDCRLKKRKNRKEGWQFKCAIVDGEKTISNRVSSRFETFVGDTLIERTAECKCRGGLAHHPEIEDIAIPTDQAPATKAGAAGAGPSQNLAVRPVEEDSGISRIPREPDSAEPMLHVWAEHFSTK
jgi:hypothetical protein